MKTFEERFWEKVEIPNWRDCWNWTASVNASGYGWFRLKKRGGPGVRGAHRIA